MAYRLKLRVPVMNGVLAVVLWLLVAAPLGALPADEDAAATRRAVAATPVAVQQVRLRLVGVRDDAAMVILGAALIALGCVVRRAA